MCVNVLGQFMVHLFQEFLIMNIRIGTYFTYYKYLNHDKKKLLLKKVLSIKQKFD